MKWDFVFLSVDSFSSKESFSSFQSRLLNALSKFILVFIKLTLQLPIKFDQFQKCLDRFECDQVSYTSLYTRSNFNNFPSNLYSSHFSLLTISRLMMLIIIKVFFCYQNATWLQATTDGTRVKVESFFKNFEERFQMKIDVSRIQTLNVTACL